MYIQFFPFNPCIVTSFLVTVHSFLPFVLFLSFAVMLPSSRDEISRAAINKVDILAGNAMMVTDDSVVFSSVVYAFNGFVDDAFDRIISVVVVFDAVLDALLAVA